MAKSARVLSQNGPMQPVISTHELSLQTPRLNI